MFGHNDSSKSDSSSMPDPSMMSSAPPIEDKQPEEAPVSAPVPTTDDTPSSNPFTSIPSEPIEPAKTEDSLADPDLMELKQKALKELSPLVSKLDQTPEEKFNTTMMMIQANDNQKLLPEAYQAAQNITDEKARAKALLDVINEINYFTQKS